VNGLVENPYPTASHMLLDYLYSYYNALPNEAAFLTSNNLAVPRELFLESGGFNISFRFAAAEDREFSHRWRRLGYRLVYAPDVVVEHFHAMGMGGFWRQHHHYGEGACQFHQMRAHSGLGKIQLEPLSFYIRLILYPFSQTGKVKALGFAFLLIISQVANMMGFLSKKRARTPSELDPKKLESRAVTS